MFSLPAQFLVCVGQWSGLETSRLLREGILIVLLVNLTLLYDIFGILVGWIVTLVGGPAMSHSYSPAMQVIPNLQIRPHRPDQTTGTKLQTNQTRPCTYVCL